MSIEMTRKGFLALLCLPVLACMLVSCAAPPKVPAEPAFNVASLADALRRGVSTEADVSAALGPPTGSGGARMPGNEGPRRIWVYEKTRVDVVGSKINITQDLLMVFFKDALFDGFLWYSDARKDTGCQPAPAN